MACIDSRMVYSKALQWKNKSIPLIHLCVALEGPVLCVCSFTTYHHCNLITFFYDSVSSLAYSKVQKVHNHISEFMELW